MTLRVVCWKWNPGRPHFKKGLVYSAQHVNRLRNMVARNLELKHEFCCITDDARGIDPGIRVIPLWDDLRHLGRCYLRLKAFAAEMCGVIGRRFVSIDLDTVITGDITPILDRDDDFIIWRNVNLRQPYCGSMWMMDAGARRGVWEDFEPLSSPVESRRRRLIGSDQAWMALNLGPGEATWDRGDGIFSFRAHVLRQSNIRRRHLKRREGKRLPEHVPLPESARMVFFHGRFDPSQPEVRSACPWVVEHWR